MVAELSLAIRPATAADLEPCSRFDPELSTDPWRAALFRESLRHSSALVAVNPESQQIAGYLLFTFHFFGRAFIEMVYVDPALRRSGIGGTLITAACAQLPGPDVFTSTNESNIPMHGLLTRLGFQHSGIVFNLDAGDPELFYNKVLSDRSAPLPAPGRDQE